MKQPHEETANYCCLTEKENKRNFEETRQITHGIDWILNFITYINTQGSIIYAPLHKNINPDGNNMHMKIKQKWELE